AALPGGRAGRRHGLPGERPGQLGTGRGGIACLVLSACSEPTVTPVTHRPPPAPRRVTVLPPPTAVRYAVWVPAGSVTVPVRVPWANPAVSTLAEPVYVTRIVQA